MLAWLKAATGPKVVPTNLRAGRTIHYMPTSCEFHIRHHLGNFKTERAALIEALRRKVPDKISQHPGDGYQAFLRGEAEALVREGKFKPRLALGAVECWAAGVGRPSPSPSLRVTVTRTSSGH